MKIRKLRSFSAAFVLFLLGSMMSTAPAINAQEVSFRAADGVYFFDTPDGEYRLQFYNPDILEVNFYPEGYSPEDYRDSHAVVLSPGHPPVQVDEHEDIITLNTGGISVLYDVRRSDFSFFYEGEPLLQQTGDFAAHVQEPEEEQEEEAEAAELAPDTGYRVDFRISETEVLMGGGARALGMNRRGHRLELYNRAHYGYETRSELMNFTIPVVLSSRKYALHFDNPTTGFLDLDSEFSNTIGFEAHSGRKSYQLVAGEDWEAIMLNYTALTGLQPLPPLWALGNFASRFGYRSQQEVIETVQAFRDENIPVDAAIIDLYWFGQEMKGTMGNLAFEPETFPEPGEMVDQLEEMDARTVLITEPFVLTTSGRWEEAVEAEAITLNQEGEPATYDFFFGNTGLIDVFKPEGKDWFWGIYQELVDTYGIHGWWGDLGEPEVHPDELQHHIGSAREVHNIYGHEWAKMVFEGYQEHYPEVRPFNLMRAGYSGSQRFGMIPWSGDVSRSWGGLKPQPEISLQMGLQGLAYMHSDLGGFAWPNEDDELYVRWMQYGVFQPIYRPHAQDDVPSEPVFRSERAKNLSRTAIELRYRLLPYIYTMAFQNAQTGLPLMRPLFFEEPDNHEMYLVSESYLFGDDMLIAPVLRPDVRQRPVHFPATADWYDFYTGKRYEGGTYQQVRTHAERIPTFVRGGAIIPMADLVQSTMQYDVQHLSLHYFYDAKAAAEPYHTRIYHDDGLTPEAHARGKYEILHLSTEIQTDENARASVMMQLELETGAGFEGDGFSEISLVLRNIEEEPTQILLNGRLVSFQHDVQTGRVEIDRFQLDRNRSKNELRINF
jgi:alpha-glucosidase (family GH31 glycosyl hydrolase)